MKRLAIFCDGTWNRLSATEPTNVVLGAQAVVPKDPSGIQQVIYYNEGVGTSYIIGKRISTWLAGAFGLGLFDKIADAYRFLVFNYEPGDEIYIFGFSRGAFTARSLAGLIRTCGIVDRDKLHKVEAAFAFYQLRDGTSHPDREAAKQFRMENSRATVLKRDEIDWRRNQGIEVPDDIPRLNVAYVGVWDTVGALGIPQHVFVEKFVRTANRYRFHDTNLSSTVGAARHAVAIDETRKSFAPATWNNLSDLNAKNDEPRYLELWFPGDHGSVGGGGDIRGLSDEALLWVLEGARKAGLYFSDSRLGDFRARIDPMAPLHNSNKPGGWMDRLYRRAPRVGPDQVADLSPSTHQRLMFEAKATGVALYRPPTLHSLFKSLGLSDGGTS